MTTAAILVLGIIASCHTPPSQPAEQVTFTLPVDRNIPMPESARDRELYAKRNPLGFLHACLGYYDEHVHDYRCIFVKQERIGAEWRPAQRMEVLFREAPFSVDMKWLQNPGRASRVSYVKGRFNDDGKEMLLAYPSGVVGLLVPNGVKSYIYGDTALQNSRKPIDRFGFRNSLELIIQYCELAKGDPQYSLIFQGTEEVEGRPSYRFERLLPYTGPEGVHPDRLLRFYIDKEWLLPTVVYAYADDAANEPLGRYMLLDPEFNIGLTDEDF